MQPTKSRPPLHAFDDPTKPIDLVLLEQQRARARRTAMQPVVTPPILDDEETRPTRPRAAVGTTPPPLGRVYPTLPARGMRPITVVLLALAAVSVALSVLFYG